MSTSTATRSGPGCFAYGCVIATVIFCVVVGGIWFFSLRSMRDAVEQYTSATLVPLASVEVQAEVDSLASEKLAGIQAALAARRELSVDFSEQEIQALIQRSSWSEWLRVSLRGEDVSVQFAFPLAALGEWYAASFLVGNITERTLVGRAQGVVKVDAGVPSLSISHLVLNNKTLEDLPRGYAAEWIVGALTNLPSGTAADSVSIQSIRKLSIHDGRLQVTVGPPVPTSGS